MKAFGVFCVCWFCREIRHTRKEATTDLLDQWPLAAYLPFGSPLIANHETGVCQLCASPPRVLQFTALRGAEHSRILADFPIPILGSSSPEKLT